MSIEAKIEKLTEALEANTIALRDVLAASVTTIQWEMATAAPAPEEKPTKKKTAKQEAQDVQEKAADPTPEPEPEPETPAAEEQAEPTAAELVQQITEAVKNAIIAPGADSNAVKTAWRAVCAEFGVEKISLLTDIGQLKAALAKAEAL